MKSIPYSQGKSPTRGNQCLKTETKVLSLDASHIPLGRDGFGFRNAQRFYQSLKIRQAFCLLSAIGKYGMRHDIWGSCTHCSPEHQPIVWHAANDLPLNPRPETNDYPGTNDSSARHQATLGHATRKPSTDTQALITRTLLKRTPGGGGRVAEIILHL